VNEEFEIINSNYKENENSTEDEIRDTFQNTRNILLLELLDSERRYVRYLHIFKEIFVLPLMTMCVYSDPKKNQIPISKEEASSLIPKGIDLLIKFSRVFLISLEHLLKDLERNPKESFKIQIGNLFLENLNLLKENYMDYPLKYRNCIEALKTMKLEKLELTNFFNSRRKLNFCDGMDFDGFLVLPLQRFIQYYKYLMVKQKDSLTTSVRIFFLQLLMNTWIMSI
jgi:hypothetical protein